MAETLASAQVIGGAVVTIEADLRKLRADVAQARLVAADAAKSIQIRVPVIADGSRLRASAEQAVRAVSTSGLAVRVPVLIDASGATTQLAALQGAMQRMMIGVQAPGGGFIGTPLLPGPSGSPGSRWVPSRVVGSVAGDGGEDIGPRLAGAEKAGRLEGEAYARGQARAYQRMERSAKDKPLRSADDLFASMLGPGSEQFIKVGFAMAISQAVGRLVNTAADMVLAGAGRNGGRIAGESGARFASERLTIGIDNLATGGAGQGLNRLQRGLFGGSVGDGIVYLTNRARLTDTETHDERRRADLALADSDRRFQLRQPQVIAANRQSLAIIQSSQAEIGGNESQARLALQQFDDAVGDVVTAAVTKARMILEQKVVKARDRDQAESIGASLGILGMGFGNDVARSLATGADSQALGQGFLSRVYEIRGARDMALAATNDPRLRARIEAQAEQQLAGERIKYSADVAEGKRRSSADLISVETAEKVARLKISRDFYKADLEAFEGAAREKLARMKPGSDAYRNEDRRLAAERQVLVAGHRQEIRQSNQQLAVAGGAAVLTALGRDYEAENLKFDAETARMLASAKSDTEREQIRKTRSDQGLALLMSHDMSRADIRASLGARGEMARANERGMGQLAGVIGTIASLNQELRNVSPEFRQATIGAHIGELQALEKQYLRPNRYASEWDTTAEAVGGPSGRSGDEVAEILKEIRDVLKERREQQVNAILGN